MNHVAIAVQDVSEPDWLEFARNTALAALAIKKHDDWDMSILICGDERISDLNKTYRHKEGPTDVLSFNQGDEFSDSKGQRRFLAGDIVISVPALMRNADDFAVSWKEELQRLIIHGILHLSGMDHATNNAWEPMLLEQEFLLESVASQMKEGLR